MFARCSLRRASFYLRELLANTPTCALFATPSPAASTADLSGLFAQLFHYFFSQTLVAKTLIRIIGWCLQCLLFRHLLSDTSASTLLSSHWSNSHRSGLFQQTISRHRRDI